MILYDILGDITLLLKMLKKQFFKTVRILPKYLSKLNVIQRKRYTVLSVRPAPVDILRLSFIFIYEGRGAIYPVTARDMTRAERRRYSGN